MSRVLEKIRTDKEIQDLKKKLREKGEYVPSFSRDEHGTIENYRKDLKNRVAEVSIQGY